MTQILKPSSSVKDVTPWFGTFTTDPERQTSPDELLILTLEDQEILDTCLHPLSAILNGHLRNMNRQLLFAVQSHGH